MIICHMLSLKETCSQAIGCPIEVLEIFILQLPL